jgi:hypothetical protein
MHLSPRSLLLSSSTHVQLLSPVLLSPTLLLLLLLLLILMLVAALILPPPITSAPSHLLTWTLARDMSFVPASKANLPLLFLSLLLPLQRACTG